MPREPIENASGTNWESFGNQLGISREPIENALRTNRECLGNQLGILREPIENASGTNWESLGNQSRMRRELIVNASRIRIKLQCRCFTRNRSIYKSVVSVPGLQPCFVAFDVLLVNDKKLANVPLSERIKHLER